MQNHRSRPLSRGQRRIAARWHDDAWPLARWAESTLINRSDCYGGHYINPQGKANRFTCKNNADQRRLAIHFAGESPEDVIGIHVSSSEETCRWAVVDIDAHPGKNHDPSTNLRLAQHIHDRSRDSGLSTRLVDSNGAGGYHVWILLAAPAPLAETWRLGKWLVHDHSSFGLSGPPETFPKRPHLSGKRYGGWVRLPGRHHKRDHWSSVWHPERGTWMVGREAVESLLGFRGRAVDLADVIPVDFTPQTMPSLGGPKRIELIRRCCDSVPCRDVRRCCDSVPCRDVERARAALACLGADFCDDYDLWLKVGMTLKGLGDEGFELWDEWSFQSWTKYDHDVLREKWSTFRPGEVNDGVTLGTLYHLARQGGWTGTTDHVIEIPGGKIRRRHRPGGGGSIEIPICKIRH